MISRNSLGDQGTIDLDGGETVTAERAPQFGGKLSSFGEIFLKIITMRTMAVNLSVERNQIQLVHSSRSS